jgi:hypothetical protein
MLWQDLEISAGQMTKNRRFTAAAVTQLLPNWPTPKRDEHKSVGAGLPHRHEDQPLRLRDHFTSATGPRI